MKTFVMFVLVLSFVLLPIATTAQDNTISYGEEVTGEITNAEFEIAYTFSGSEGDVIAAKLGAPELGTDFSSPALILLNADNSILAANESILTSTAIGTILPSDGEYTLLATRRDGRTGSAVGEFVLTLLNLENLLDVGEVSSTITTEFLDEHFYMVQTSDPFTLTYTRTGGEFAPNFAVKVANEEGVLQRLATISGIAESGSLTINPANHGSNTFFVTVQRDSSDYHFETVTADYTISVSQ